MAQAWWTVSRINFIAQYIIITVDFKQLLYIVFTKTGRLNKQNMDKSLIHPLNQADNQSINQTVD